MGIPGLASHWACVLSREPTLPLDALLSLPGTQESPSLLLLPASPLPEQLCPCLGEGPYKEPGGGRTRGHGPGASAGCLLPVPSTRTARCLSVFLTHLITQVAAASAFALPKSRAPIPVAQASGPLPAEGLPLILPFPFMIYKTLHRCCTFYLN